MVNYASNSYQLLQDVSHPALANWKTMKMRLGMEKCGIPHGKKREPVLGSSLWIESWWFQQKVGIEPIEPQEFWPYTHLLHETATGPKT